MIHQETLLVILHWQAEAYKLNPKNLKPDEIWSHLWKHEQMYWQ